MAKPKGTPNRDTPTRLRRATWLCSEIQLGSGGRKAPELERKLVGDIGTSDNRNGGRTWRRWEAGRLGMSDVDFHKIALAAIKLGWLDGQRAAEAGFSATFAGQAQASAKEALELHKEKLEELRAFIHAKEQLLVALDHFTATCDCLKHSRPVDAGDRDLRLLEAEQDSLDDHDRDLLQRLGQEIVFTPLPDPRVLRLQLERTELSFPDTGRSSQSTAPVLHRSTRRERDELLQSDLITGDDHAATSGQKSFAGLAKLSEKYQLQARRRRLKRLESLATGRSLPQQK